MAERGRKPNVYRVGPGDGVRRFWAPGQPSLSGGRLARQGFWYYAFRGRPIKTLDPSFSGEIAQDIANAASELHRLNNAPPRTQLLEAVARQLLRTEAVASSRIEGLELSHRKLAEASFDAEDRSENARTVLGNVRALEEAIDRATRQRLKVEDLLAINHRLFEGTRDEARAGILRTSQNWIGKRDDPWGADFIPVPEDDVRPLLEDLCEFIARDDLPAVAQAAIAHAQFETIHPFFDGNGRVGRCLIHAILRKRGLAPYYVPPISVVLSANREQYVRGLTAYRDDAIADWCGTFARAVHIASQRSESLATDIEALKERWREQADRPRTDSASARLIDLLPSYPVVDLGSVRKVTGASDEAARVALDRLARAGVINELTDRQRDRSWEAVGLFALLDQFERTLATPAGATRPVRAAPRNTRGAAGRAPRTS